MDKESGIENWPLQDVPGKEVRAIIERLAYVGAESDRLISELPDEFEPKHWSPTKTGLEAYAKQIAGRIQRSSFSLCTGVRARYSLKIAQVRYLTTLLMF
ncbi:MAG: hypothetical protein OXI27_08380 [Thaumarchaeota archaeon]|nr:hypothetical protein [Nitrososphaerota archaeon]